MKLGSDFRELLTLLNGYGVKYLVIGAYALAGHGFPRNTKDLDVFYEATPDNARLLMQALADFGFSDVGITVDELSSPGDVIQLGFAPNRIDLINQISGVAFDSAWNGRDQIEMDGIQVNVIGLREFIMNKKASGRLADLADLERLGE